MVGYIIAAMIRFRRESSDAAAGPRSAETASVGRTEACYAPIIDRAGPQGQNARWVPIIRKLVAGSWGHSAPVAAQDESGPIVRRLTSGDPTNFARRLLRTNVHGNWLRRPMQRIATGRRPTG